MRTALILIVLATLYRLLPTLDMSLSNFSPVMAIGFCGAVYFRNRWMWLVPFAALSLSDLYINWFYAREYGFHWPVSGVIARTACFAAAIGSAAGYTRLGHATGGHSRDCLFRPIRWRPCRLQR